MPPLRPLFPGEQEEDIEDDLEEDFDGVEEEYEDDSIIFFNRKK
jgi:hypothetical protein